MGFPTLTRGLEISTLNLTGEAETVTTPGWGGFGFRSMMSASTYLSSNCLVPASTPASNSQVSDETFEGFPGFLSTCVVFLWSQVSSLFSRWALTSTVSI